MSRDEGCGAENTIATCFQEGYFMDLKISAGRISDHAGQAASENAVQEDAEPTLLSTRPSSCRRMAAPGRPIVCWNPSKRVVPSKFGVESAPKMQIDLSCLASQFFQVVK